MDSTPKIPILEAKKVSKHFSGVYVLKNISLKIYPGEVNAIIGENGAGKSTLMKIISGVYPDYEGTLELNGKEVRFGNPAEAEKQGISIIHQELNLVPHMSIAENLFLGKEPKTKAGLADFNTMNRVTKEITAKLHLDMPPAALISELRVGQMQLVEIAKALLNESKILIMDEPTSALSDHEVELLFRIIRELRSKGVAILYISHKLHELFEIADSFTVLRDGEFVGSGSMKEITHEKIIAMMVGRKINLSHSRKLFTKGKELLRVENLCLTNPEGGDKLLVDHVSFSLSKGEILGISGLMGAGRSEMLEALFGVFPKFTSGKIFIEGKEVKIRSVRQAIKAGIALVPEDRKLQGLILKMNIPENTSMANFSRVSNHGFISKRKEEALSRAFIEKLNISVPSRKIEVEKLSGGNQQKVVIARWLATDPKILLLDEPTRGIDVGAKGEIYKLINELAAQGMGIVVVSSELPEILALSDKILVLSESRLTAVMNRNEASEEKIMRAAIAGRRATSDRL